MVDAARVVGISAFLGRTPRTPLAGAIKKRPADFVVQEISLDDRTLSLAPRSTDSDVERLPTQAERDAVVAEMEIVRLNSKQRAKEPLVFEDPADGWHEELRRLVQDEATIAHLKRVAAADADEERPCVLDAPVEFRDRVYLQICIQHCFPSVDCKIRKRDVADPPSPNAVSMEQQQIEVVQDGMYKKFRKAGISESNACTLLAFIRKGAAHADAVRGVELTHDDTKEARTALHRQISSASNVLKTRTETRGGKQCLVVGFSPHNSKKRKRADQPPEPYLRFVLQKVNLEHFTCFERMARLLKRPVSAFATAGTKDKVAVTYQHVTVQNLPPERLLELNGSDGGDTDRTSGASFRVGYMEYVATPMSLGGLQGNRFSIVVRDLPMDLTDTDMEDRILHVEQHGFVNYFGFQRVGLPTSTVRPHQIGELIVARKWEDAVKTIFTPSDHDPPDCAAAKAAFLANPTDVDAVLKLIPLNSMQVERSVLTGLKRHGVTAWEAAIRGIAFSRRTMYLHAYQSFLFNAIASYRIDEYGTSVVEGDLIREIGDNNQDSVIVASIEKAAEINARLENPLACVVLPLPGSNVLTPTNKTGLRLQQLLDEHGTVTALKESSELKGTYRALVEKPRDVKWESVNDDERAVQIQFSLNSGCFATMCLREILRYNL